MFAKGQEEQMKAAAKSHKRIDPQPGDGNDDLSAYEGMTPGVSREPMTEDDISFSMDYDSGSEQGRDQMPPGQFVPNQQDGQYDPALMPPRPDMAPSPTDDELFPGGPLMTEFMAWQKDFPDMYIVDDLPDGNVYIYRTITRYEYKQLQALPNTDPLQREELIIDRCMLYPVITYEDMSSAMAGVISILAQHILTSSGFVKNSVPRKL